MRHAYGRTRYHDAATGIWYSYAQGTWHYSIDTCQSWVDVNMLDIRVVEGTGTVDTFGAQLWSHTNGALLQFFDTRYAQSGWHNMTEFVVEYYDGVGYDGEPLRAVDVAVTGEESDDTLWLNNLSPTGANPEPPSPDATITRWDTYLYGQWDHKLLCSYSIFAPAGTTAYTSSADLDGTSAMSASAAASAAPSYTTWNSSEPLTVLVHADDTPGGEWHKDATGTNEWKFYSSGEALLKPIIYWNYSSTGYSLEHLVQDLEACTEKINKEKGLTGSNRLLIQNLAIQNHANVGDFCVGSTDVTPDNICSRYYGLFKQLNDIMVDGGQIQHYGCLIAGVNPYHDPKCESQIFEPGTTENQAWYARRMLATMAEASKCYLFASSDSSSLIVEKLSLDGSDRYVVTWSSSILARSTDMCLEFGVGPDGKQVGYWMCDQRPWNLENWLLSSGGYPDSLQDLDGDELLRNEQGAVISTTRENDVDRLYTPLTYAWP